MCLWQRLKVQYRAFISIIHNILNSLNYLRIFVFCACTRVGASSRNVSFFDPPFVVTPNFGLIGSYCRGRKNIPDLRGRS